MKSTTVSLLRKKEDIMATKTFEELKQLAIQIRDEKTNKQNTATRIGTQMLEHLNKLEQDYYDKTATDEELKQRDEKLTELSSGSGKIMQLPSSFIKTYDGLGTLVRANNFYPAKVYGIVYYASSIGYFDLYSLNKEDYSVFKITTVLAEKAGINYYILEEPFTITDNLLLGYAGTIIGTRNDGRVLGMWQAKISEIGSNNFYNNYEACYGIITSELSLDDIIRLNATENNAILFKSPIGRDFEIQGLKDLWRGNRITGGKVYSLMIYAEQGDYIQYALLDASNKTLSHKSDSIYIAKGWNYINIPNGIDVDLDNNIVVKSEHNSIPISSKSPCIGLAQFNEQESKVIVYSDYEIAIYCITNDSFDRYLYSKNKQDIIMPFNDIYSINKYKNIFARANNHPDCVAKGLVIYSVGSSIIEYGLMDTNNESYPLTKIGECFVKNGINKILFDSPIEAKNGKKIYIYNNTNVSSVGVTDTNGMGMYQNKDGEGKFYTNWEVAYGIILDYGGKNLDDNYELRYGEIVLPKDIYSYRYTMQFMVVKYC